MQEIKKRRILLASVLKPVDEPRMFERMGQSLAQHGFEVFIMGFPPTSANHANGIHFLPHKKFDRISIQRGFARLEILWKIFTLLPDVLIVSTHELLGAAVVYRLLTGKKIIYDVQENYWSNIVYTNAFPKFLRYAIAFFVRFKELIASIFITKFLLAEKCYANEIGFVKKRYTVIENKCQIPDYFQRKLNNDFIQLVFTGMLAESTGVFKAIELAKKLFQVNQKIKLNIVGYCAQSKTLQQLKSEINSFPFIQLTGGENFVSHAEIMKAIREAHFGIICYPLSPHIENKVPTKLYEYLACQLPILLQDHEPWKKICAPNKAAIVIDWRNINIDTIVKRMSEETFYTNNPINVTWQSEEKTFLDAINNS